MRQRLHALPLFCLMNLLVSTMGFRTGGGEWSARRLARARAQPLAFFKFFEARADPDKTLESSRLVPDVLSAPFDATVDLEVRYPAWVRSSVDMRDFRSFGDTPTEGAGQLNQRGVVVKPTQVRAAPRLSWAPAAAGASDNDPLAAAPGEKPKLYTVALIDPDAPRPDQPTSRSWLHWLVVNIPGDDVDAGKTLRSYVGAFPPAQTPPHRYFFLLMEQRAGEQRFQSALPAGDGLSAEDVRTRSNWSLSQFVAENQLKLVGWHHFVAEFDPYCMELLADLKALR